MKLSCLQENLSRALASVSRSVATKTTLPITQHVLIATDQGRLKLYATNLEMGTATWTGAMIEEEGSIAVPYRRLADIVNTLPSDRLDIEVVEAEEGGGKVMQLTCGRGMTIINASSPDDFPPEPDVTGETVALEPSVLRSGINMTAFSAGTEEERPVLTGMEMKLEENAMTVAAADGFRLAIFHKTLEQTFTNPAKVIIPAKTMQEVNRLSADQTSPISITLSERQAKFNLEDAIVYTQLIQGNYPNYEQLVPERYDSRAVVDMAELKQAIVSASVFAKDGSNIVRIEMEQEENGPGRMRVSARSEEVGYNTREFDVSTLEGEPGQIAFNCRYLQDIVNAMRSEQVILEITNSSSPGVFRIQGNEDFCHIVMPMYVQW